MYIYADILMITNIYIDFLLINAARMITHSPMKTIRGIIGAVIGSLFSLVIFAPHINAFITAAINLISAAVIVFTAFGFDNIRSYIKRLFVYYLCSFIFAGLGTGLAYFSGEKMIISRNGIIYADFSFPALILTSVTAYGAVLIYKRVCDYSADGDEYIIIISDNQKTVQINAIADTGNILTDSFTGKPVIVCRREDLEMIYDDIPDENSIMLCSKTLKWRLIPYSTASGNGLMPIIHPADVCIKNVTIGKIYRADVYLGASAAHTAVFNPGILI